MNIRNTILAVMTATIVVVFPAFAATITISNPSFELPAQTLGGWTNGTITGWALSGSGGVYWPNGTITVGQVTGNQVAWAMSGSISQTLATNLAANTQYVLSVDLINRIDMPNVTSTVALIAGGKTLASSVINGGTPGAKVTQTVSYTSCTAVTGGQALGISLTSGGQQSDWDNVQLTATPFVAGTANKLVFVQQPSTTIAGTSIAPSITVSIVDQNGCVITTGASSKTKITLSIGNNPGGGAIGGTVTATAAAGVATFNKVTISNAGTGYTLVAKDGALTSATSSAFNITPAGTITVPGYSFELPAQSIGGWTNGVATSWTVSASGQGGVFYPPVSSLTQGAFDGNQVGWSMGGSLTQFLTTKLAKNTQYTLSVELQNRNDMPNVSSTLELLAGTLASNVVLGSSVIVGGTGGTNVKQTVSYTSCATGANIGKALGITLISGGQQSDWDNVSLNGVAFPPGAATATKLAFVQQPTNTIAGASIIPAITVAVLDQNGCPMTTGASATSSVTLSIGTNPGGGSLGGTVTVKAKAGVATFSGLTIDQVGTGYTLKAVDGALTSTTSSAFNILPGNSITIPGYSFELPAQSLGGWTNGTATSWTVSGSGGVFYPTVASLSQRATDGNQVGWSMGGSLTQTLATNLAANTQYTLSVDLQSRNDMPNVTSTVELLANGNVLASSVINGGTPGTNALQTVTYTSGASGVNIGKPLGIKLISGGQQSDWDNVRLTASPSPLALYHMDESVWLNGASGQVIDSSGNGYNAQTVNSAKTASASPSPAITTNPGTCNYGVMTGGVSPTVTNGYVTFPTTFPHLTTGFTIAAWIYPTNVNANAFSRIFTDDTGTKGYGLSIGDKGAGVLSFYTQGITPAAKVYLNSTYKLSANTWYFVAAVVDGTVNKRTIYVFDALGNLLNTTADATAVSKWTTGTGAVYIGHSFVSPNNYYFKGSLDEVQIYQSVLSQPAITALATQTHACPTSTLNHLEIQNASGTGLTCAASTLTIKACSDAAIPCVTPYTSGVSGTLTATGTPTVNWDAATGGSGFAIPSGSSLVTKNVQVASAGSVAFGITSPSPVPTVATVCNFGSPSCTFTASLAGFIFSNSTTGTSYNIPAQVSGIASTSMYLRAVQATTANPAVCTPAIIGQTVSPTMGYVCNNPAACQAGSLATINTTAIAPTGTPVSLSFDSNGSSLITARYDDVGQITLNANYTTTPLFSGAKAVTLNGTSNSYVVAPHSFGFSGITSGPTIKAGNNFSATITAYNGLSTPTVTPNFGKETPAEGVTLTSTLVTPVGGTNPMLGNDVIPGSEFGAGGMVNDPNGVASVTDLTWGEVGNITLTANLTNANGYLGSGKTATGTSANVGRFIPDHFDTAVIQTGTSPALVPMNCPPGLGISCPSTFNGMVYSGQPFSLQITAMNSNELTTQNYDHNLLFSKVVTLSPYSSLGGATLLANGTLGVTSETAFVSGTLTDATEKYIFSTILTTPTNIYIRAVDTDGVTSLRTSSIEGGVAVASGRLKVPNVYGSELLPLSMAATAQFYNASNNWVTSSTDNLTSLTLPTSYSIGTGTTNVTTIPVTGVVSGGVLTINLSAPLQPGSALVAPTVTPASLLLTPTLGGVATFGIYRGNNSLIYMRENY